MNPDDASDTPLQRTEATERLERTERPERCLLSVPASSPRFFAKAAASDADTIMLDLEDAVAPDAKPQARQQAIEALNTVDWGTRNMMVRINGLDTPWWVQDLTEVVRACPRLDLVMVPKIERPREVQAVELILQGLERAMGRDPANPVGLEILIESALGLTNVEAIASCSPRLESISFGPGDYAASIGNRSKLVGGPDPDYTVLTYPDAQGNRETHWNDAWHYPLARIGAACRAHGLRALDGPYVDYNDADGFRAAARRVAALGFDGKWAIHPTQIPLANGIFGPTPEEIAWATQLLHAMEQAHTKGAGAISMDGQMIDMAHVRQARRIKAQAERIEARAG